MKLFEKLLYSSVLFIAVYVLLSMGLRMFHITEVYTSHMIGGIAATVAAILLFMFLLIKKQSK